MTPATTPGAAAILAERVFAGGETKPFGEFTVTEVDARANELRSVTGFGPTAKVASVASAWADLARLMRDHGAETVAEAPADELVARAEQLWIRPPGGSLL